MCSLVKEVCTKMAADCLLNIEDEEADEISKFLVVFRDLPPSYISWVQEQKVQEASQSLLAAYICYLGSEIVPIIAALIFYKYQEVVESITGFVCHNRSKVFWFVCHNCSKVFSPICHIRSKVFWFVCHNRSKVFWSICHNHSTVFSPICNNHSKVI